MHSIPAERSVQRRRPFHQFQFKENRMNANSVFRFAGVWILTLLVFSLFPLGASAADIVAFGGIQHTGDISVKAAVAGTSSLIQNLTPKTFGVFGVRIAHGNVFGGEYTAEYAPNFISSASHAWIFHGNLRAQIPVLKVVRPYGTAGIGLLNSSGSSTSSLGTEFLFNYGGGINFVLGPIGLNFDVRGYTLPSVHVAGFDIQDKINFIQPTVGIVFSFK
jgi:Outer membrane protein beta-barrel domain